MFGPPDSDVVTGALRAVEQFDVPHERYGDPEQMRRRWTQFAFAGTDVRLFDSGGGVPVDTGGWGVPDVDGRGLKLGHHRFTRAPGAPGLGR
jgi:hypothetical protein